MSLLRRFDSMTERERKLVTGFGAFLGVVFLIGLPLYLKLTLMADEDTNEQIAELIQQIDDERPSLVNRKDEVARVSQRYARKAPVLAGFLSGLAEQAGVQIPETQDRATVPHGKTVKERQTRIKLSKVGMLALSTFLEKIEQSGYAVSVTHIDLQKRSGKPDEFDVELDVSAFDVEEPKKAPAKPAAAEEDDE